MLDLSAGETAEVISILPGERQEWARTVAKIQEILGELIENRSPKLVAAALGLVLKERLTILRHPTEHLASDPLPPERGKV